MALARINKMAEQLREEHRRAYNSDAFDAYGTVPTTATKMGPSGFPLQFCAFDPKQSEELM